MRCVCGSLYKLGVLRRLALFLGLVWRRLREAFARGASLEEGNVRMIGEYVLLEVIFSRI